MRLLFVRHGESEANVARVFANRGWSHPLTDKGRRQALALVQTLADRELAAIYSSPLQRAVETGQIIAQPRGLPVEIEPALIEYHVGIYEGRPLDQNGAIQRYNEVAQKWTGGDFSARLPDGESGHDIRARFIPFFNRLRDRHQESNATILLVGHGGTFTHALPMILPNLSCAMTLATGLDNCSFAEACLQNGDFRCIRWGAITFD